MLKNMKFLVILDRGVSVVDRLKGLGCFGHSSVGDTWMKTHGELHRVQEQSDSSLTLVTKRTLTASVSAAILSVRFSVCSATIAAE